MIVSLPAMAEYEYSRTSCYVGLAGTIGVQGQVGDFVDSGSDFGEHFSGVHGRLGCRRSWAAGEIHFEWLDGFTGKFFEDQTARFNGYAVTLNGKAYILQFLQQSKVVPEFMRFKLPADWNRIQPYGLLGFGALDFDGPGKLGGWSFLGRFGGGIEFWLTREIAFDLEMTYAAPTSAPLENQDFYSISLGVNYSF